MPIGVAITVVVAAIGVYFLGRDFARFKAGGGHVFTRSKDRNLELKRWRYLAVGGGVLSAMFYGVALNLDLPPIVQNAALAGCMVAIAVSFWSQLRQSR